jgi:hypothetical protein
MKIVSDEAVFGGDWQFRHTCRDIRDEIRREVSTQS